jgi:hypothetical protein
MQQGSAVGGDAAEHEGAAVRKALARRMKVLRVGSVLAIVCPIYFVAGCWIGSKLKFSDSIGMVWVFGTAQWIALAALVCGIAGKGSGRWKVITGSVFEMAFIWFMSIGL